MQLKSVDGQAIFPTPIWFARYEGFEETNRAIVEQMDRVDWQASHARRGLALNVARRHDEDIFITFDEVPAVAEVAGAFARNCTEIADEFGWDLERHELRITGLWAHVTPAGKITQLHHHLPSLLSCAYYVLTPPNCGTLRFLDDRKQRMWEPVSRNDHDLLRQAVEVQPEEGLMVIFPASLDHQVGENASGERRISISMNADLVRVGGDRGRDGLRIDRSGALVI